MKLSFLLYCAFFTLVLSGCTGNFRGLDDEQSIALKGYRFSEVQLVVPAALRTQLKRHRAFKTARFKRTLTRQLRRSGLLQQQAPYRLTIRLTHLFTRNTVAAVLLPVSGSDRVTAEIEVAKPGQAPEERFAVDARYSLGGTASGWAPVRMTMLYHNFALMLSNLFSGQPTNQEI